MAPTYAIVNIDWARIRVTLTVQSSEPDGQSTFALTSGEHTVPVHTMWVDDTHCQLRIDVATFHRREPIPAGTWRLHQAPTGQPVRCEPAHHYRLLEAGRTFRYADDRKALQVRISEDEQSAAIIARYLSRPYRLAVDGPITVLRHTLGSIDFALRSALVVSWYWLNRALTRRSLHRTRILFASEMRESLGGNLLRIRQRMTARGLDKKVTIRESFRIPSQYTIVSSLRMIRQVAWADIVLVDDYFGIFTSLQPSPRTKIIQVWHAGGSFKVVGFSRLAFGGIPRLRNAHRRYTYAICSARALVPTYAEGFGIEDEAVIPTGLPRVDMLLDPDEQAAAAARFAQQFPQVIGKRIVLFAPTFRGFGVYQAHYDFTRIDFDALAGALPPDTVVLFRMHHFVREPVPIPEQYRDRFFDVTGVGDTNDFLHAADVLISDYSSIIYEFALLGKPMLFYAFDLDEYAAERGFYQGFAETVPGKVCHTFPELAAALRDGDYDIAKLEAFRQENFDYADTGSGDRVLDWLVFGEPPDPLPVPPPLGPPPAAEDEHADAGAASSSAGASAAAPRAAASSPGTDPDAEGAQ